MGEIRHCPRCDLRFTNPSELQSHLYDDHDVPLPGMHPATVEPRVSERITVPVDPQRPGSPAVAVACVVAAQASWSVDLVAATPPGLDERSTERFLAGVARSGTERCVHKTVQSLGPGKPADLILEHVRSSGSPLICMATHGRGAAGEAVFGSVSESVVRRSPVPVLVCGPRVRPEATYRRVLVAVDGSELSERALRVASDIARSAGADTHLLEVLDPAEPVPSDVYPSIYLHRLAANSPAPIAGYDTVTHRYPPRAIADLAGLEPGTIVALGTHGRSGFERMRAGSVALEVVRRTSCPVLIVPVGASVSSGAA